MWRIRITCPVHGEQVHAVRGGADYIREHYPSGTSVCPMLDLIPGQLNRICGATMTVVAERAIWKVVDLSVPPAPAR
jgi:hypothetical protein